MPFKIAPSRINGQPGFMFDWNEDLRLLSRYCCEPRMRLAQTASAPSLATYVPQGARLEPAFSHSQRGHHQSSVGGVSPSLSEMYLPAGSHTISGYSGLGFPAFHQPSPIQVSPSMSFSAEGS